ncbi:MAG: alpha/beta fold hydrolase [Proteobacteria bacterium]|nr:alpha/beta fold hydrolase [Pseudomonadota bacterium]MBU1389561.1 alpha/beta fold hydrolase [Pseudomonadota bacterium]MBU1544425.1 alpha/beta fold hydrolase [Pseudomonadota bacterium]MBU2480699.1 alpha/beta fold hydrolase [Pseudomonadota bacterium]
MVERIINGKKVSTKGFEDIYPFDSNFININGHSLHYIDQGKGKPLVMIHGNPTWSFYFRHLILGLSSEFRTVVPDHIGCGLSDKPDDKSYHYTLKSRVKDLDALINQLNLEDKISLIVHDWGGMIGLAWAVDHMERIDKIVITNTSGFFLPRGKQFPLRLWLIKYLNWFAVPAVLGFNIFSRAALVMAVQKKLSSKIKNGLTAPYNSWKNRIATLKFVQDIPISEKDQSYCIVKHVEDQLKGFDDNQLLFLWGAKDFVFDLSFFNEFKKRFPKSKSHVFDDAGHYLFEDHPEQTLALIHKFLKS